MQKAVLFVKECQGERRETFLTTLVLFLMRKAKRAIGKDNLKKEGRIKIPPWIIFYVEQGLERKDREKFNEAEETIMCMNGSCQVCFGFKWNAVWAETKQKH